MHITHAINTTKSDGNQQSNYLMSLWSLKKECSTIQCNTVQYDYSNKFSTSPRFQNGYEVNSRWTIHRVIAVWSFYFMFFQVSLTLSYKLAMVTCKIYVWTFKVMTFQPYIRPWCTTLLFCCQKSVREITGLSRDVTPLTDGHQLNRNPTRHALIYARIGRLREKLAFTDMLLLWQMGMNWTGMDRFTPLYTLGSGGFVTEPFSSSNFGY